MRPDGPFPPIEPRWIPDHEERKAASSRRAIRLRVRTAGAVLGAAGFLGLAATAVAVALPSSTPPVSVHILSPSTTVPVAPALSVPSTVATSGTESTGTVVVTFTTASGAAVGNTPGPIDNLYVPGGTPGDGVFEVIELSSSGVQTVPDLRPGTLRIDGVRWTLTCRGPGVTADPGVAGADVVVTAGATVHVACVTDWTPSG